MSDECFLYGAILGAYGTTSNWYDLYKKNARVLEALPEEDEAPALTRNMFAFPERYGVPGFYRYQMIHFGASFNHFGDDWHLWLEKFENLLRKLYWFEAHLHLDAGNAGAYDYHWKVSFEQVPQMKEGVPLLGLDAWTFRGGPRRLCD